MGAGMNVIPFPEAPAATGSMSMLQTALAAIGRIDHADAIMRQCEIIETGQQTIDLLNAIVATTGRDLSPGEDATCDASQDRIDAAKAELLRLLGLTKAQFARVTAVL
jgi:hypothetical protein